MEEAKKCAEELKSACFQMPGCRAIPTEEVFVEIITKHMKKAIKQSQLAQVGKVRELETNPDGLQAPEED